MRALPVAVIWTMLLAATALEFAVGPTFALVIGAASAVLIAFSFMRLAHTPGLPGAFALVAVFWLAILLGLGSLDPATRHDIGVAAQIGQ